VSLGNFSVVPPTEPCALRSTQPLKVSTRDFSWGKGSWYVWLMTYHPCSAETSRKFRALTYLEPLGPPQPVAGDLYFTFYLNTCTVSVTAPGVHRKSVNLSWVIQTIMCQPHYYNGFKRSKMGKKK